MPGNVVVASPVDVLPAGLCTLFQESREWASLISVYPDGSVQAQPLVGDSRKAWRIMRALSPTDSGALLAFYLAHKVTPFYYYDPYYSGTYRFFYDATGVSTHARYTVRFTGSYSTELRIARNITNLSLIQVI